VKKADRTFYNATQAAEYMGVTRQRFYVIKEKYRIRKCEKGYPALELAKVRHLMDKWLRAHGK